MSVRFVVSQRGSKIVVFEGHRFRKERTMSSGETKWRCNEKTCRAFLKISGVSNTILEKNVDHNHDPIPESKLERQELSARAKKKAVDDICDGPSKILRSVMTDSNTQILKKSDISRVRRNMYNARRKKINANNELKEEEQEDDDYEIEIPNAGCEVQIKEEPIESAEEYNYNLAITDIADDEINIKQESTEYDYNLAYKGSFSEREEEEQGNPLTVTAPQYGNNPKGKKNLRRRKKALNIGSLDNTTPKARRSWDPDNMAKAIDAVRQKKIGLKKASKTFQVPRSTLQRLSNDKYGNPITAAKTKVGRPTVLCSELEHKLVNYCLTMEASLGPTQSDLRRMALQLAEKNNLEHPFKDEMAGRKWLNLFVKRHKTKLAKCQIPEMASNGYRVTGIHTSTDKETIGIVTETAPNGQDDATVSPTTWHLPTPSTSSSSPRSTAPDSDILVAPSCSQNSAGTDELSQN